MPAFLWATDVGLRFTSLNGAGLRATNLSISNFLGKSVDALFRSAKPSEKALQAHRDALQGQIGSFDVELNGRDLEAQVEALRDPDGSIAGVIGVALDVTGRAVAERALRLSEQSYRLLIEEAPYAICRATDSGQLLQVNRVMLEMLGYGPGSEADLLVCDLPQIFAVPGGFSACRDGLVNGCTVQGFETKWFRRDGQEIQVQVGGRAVRDAQGRISYLDLLAENITERKHLEERLGQAEKMQAIGQLAGGVAHDFNNLLTVIGGQIEVMLGKTLDSDLQHRLEDVKRAADRAAALTKQLLAFSRRQVLQSKLFDINQLIEHLSRMLRRLLREDIELTIVPGHDPGSVRADPNQIEQVLINLVVNAQDAMPGGGRLTIETAKVAMGESPWQPGALEPGEYVLISVRDTGQGMDRDTQARVFEPFFTTKKVGAGTGLGLSTAYGVVRQSRGNIQVESQPGEGSTFRVYLPSVRELEPIRQVSAPVVTPRGHETILIAEDESSVRKLLAAHLRSLGYNVLTGSDGLTAMEAAHSHNGKIDLLLSDLIMPKMGGRELADELRKTVPGLKAIFVSGYAGNPAGGKELDLPQAYFLQKPFSMVRLAKTVRDVLDGFTA